MQTMKYRVTEASVTGVTPPPSLPRVTETGQNGNLFAAEKYAAQNVLLKNFPTDSKVTERGLTPPPSHTRIYP